ncbi:Permease of the major facilitator superfamily [Candidatus Burkholderia brachyanthoides]|nr:Permease of the major facilitator superfamily [Candidatus Burkholderia brachyanthoides]
MAGGLTTHRAEHEHIHFGGRWRVPGRAHGSPACTWLIAAAAIGNALEFYDFTVYAFFVLTIASCFFPVNDAVGQLLLAVASFGVGFFTRPVGGLLIGMYAADRAGRKRTMLLVARADGVRHRDDRRRADLCAGGHRRSGHPRARAADSGLLGRRRSGRVHHRRPPTGAASMRRGSSRVRACPVRAYGRFDRRASR